MTITEAIRLDQGTALKAVGISERCWGFESLYLRKKMETSTACRAGQLWFPKAELGEGYLQWLMTMKDTKAPVSHRTRVLTPSLIVLGLEGEPTCDMDVIIFLHGHWVGFDPEEWI